MRVATIEISGGRDAAPFLVGLVSLPAQALLCRELLARGGGNEVALTLYLALWLAGSALGARFWEGRTRVPSRALLLAAPVLAGSALAVVRLLPAFGGLPGEMPSPAAIALTGLVVLLPAGFLTAGLFPLAARDSAGNLGRAYVIEALGALVGGCATTVLVIARVAPLAIVALVAAAAAAIAVRRWRGLVAAAVLLALALSGIATRIDAALFRLGWAERHPGLQLAGRAMTPTRVLTLATRERERWLLADDAPREVLDDPYRDEATAALLVASSPMPPRSILLVDFGASGVARALLQGGVRRVACLLPDPEDTILARPVAGIRYVTGDPRRSIRRDRDRWDVIALAAGEGTSLAANRLWTTEAFHEMAARLAHSGVIVAISPGGDAAPGPEARRWRSSVAAALAKGTGTKPAAIDADRFVLVADRSRGRHTSLDPDSLAARYVRAGAGLASYPVARFAVEYPRDRLQKMPFPSSVPANSDARPAALAASISRWLRLSGLPVPGRSVLVVLAAVLIATPSFARRGKSVLLATGAASMGLDLLVLISYQAKVGMLQGGLGVLLGAFLGGTAAGAYVGGRSGIKPGVLCVAQGIIAGLSALVLPAVPGATLLFALLAFLLGATCGAPFPSASRELGAGRAWASDAAGGILGAILFLLVISQGIVTAGLTLAAMPFLAAIRLRLTSTVPGSRSSISGTARP